MKNVPFYEYEIEIAGYKIQHYYGMIYINGKEMDSTSKSGATITNILTAFLKEKY
ncbi:unnamed protein product, partial [marine sediment metagenome]